MILYTEVEGGRWEIFPHEIGRDELIEQIRSQVGRRQSTIQVNGQEVLVESVFFEDGKCYSTVLASWHNIWGRGTTPQKYFRWLVNHIQSGRPADRAYEDLSKL